MDKLLMSHKASLKAGVLSLFQAHVEAVSNGNQT